MNKSSKLKKIMSFFLVTMLVMNAIVLPVSADTTKQVIYPAGTYPDDSYHSEYEYFGNCPKYTPDDLVYTGDLSTDVRINFNIKKQYGLDWTTDTGFYMSRPFSLRRRWDAGDSSSIVNFTGNYSNINQLFSKERFDTIASSSFVKSNNIVMSGYDVFYTLRTTYSVTREYGYLSMTYIFVPKDHRIAISNQNEDEDGSGSIRYGIWLSPDGATSDITPIYNSCWSVTFRYGTEGGSVATYPNAFYDAPFSDWLGMSHMNLIATNIPIFTKADSAKQYIISGESTEDPTNKIPSSSKGGDNGRISADAFGWDSFDCALVQDGNSYKFIYTYTPGTSDMKKNSSDYFFTADYSQNVKYRIIGQTASGELYKSRSSTMSKDNVLDSGGSSINTFKELSIKVYDGSDSDGSSGTWFRFAINNLVNGGDLIQGSTEILSSYIYITVTLKHKRYDSPTRNPNDPLSKVSLDISSDVRWFKFDAVTGKKLDSSEVGGQVVTKDSVDSDGSVITDSNGNPIKEVSQIITNDNSTHTTINNYYYDSNGKQSSNSDGSDILSNILSTLIKFIKTLVTEGLPAALEILKTLISSITGIVSDALNNIDIGSGTTNGILAVFKALPPAMWSLLLIGILVLVVVGIINRIF